MISRLILGTVQLGMPYGISNKAGKPDFDTACDIIKTAFDLGITRFDTAQAYGDSEDILGRVFHAFKLGAQVKVYSKLHPELDLRNEDVICQSVNNSLCKLKIDKLEGLLLHHEDELRFWNKGLARILRGLIVKGKVRLIGVSFYTPQMALDALDINGIDMINIPANILDQRFENAGVFSKARECGKEVFVRSIFLQGLLLMPVDRVPVSMKYVLPYLERLEQMACGMKLSRQELVLGYAAQKWPDSFILFGAENKMQVIDNIRAFSSKNVPKIDKNIFNNVEENVLNPIYWPKL